MPVKVNKTGGKAIDRVLAELHEEDTCEHCDKMRAMLESHEMHRIFLALGQLTGG